LPASIKKLFCYELKSSCGEQCQSLYFVLFCQPKSFLL